MSKLMTELQECAVCMLSAEPWRMVVGDGARWLCLDCQQCYLDEHQILASSEINGESLGIAGWCFDCQGDGSSPHDD